MKIRIYYEDTDCGGIVYHTNYIKYCERARSELFFSHHTPPSVNTCGFVVSALEAKFLGSAKLGDILEVRTSIKKLGAIQLILAQDIYNVESNLAESKMASLDSTPNIAPLDSSAKHRAPCIFTSTIKLGYIDVCTKKPAQIPKHFLNILSTIPKSAPN